MSFSRSALTFALCTVWSCCDSNIIYCCIRILYSRITYYFLFIQFFSPFFSSSQSDFFHFSFAGNLANRHNRRRQRHHPSYHRIHISLSHSYSVRVCARVSTICFTIIMEYYMYLYCVCMHIRIKHRRVAKLFVYELKSLGASNP